MIIIRVIGGLGNQMFQYALYKAFENRGKEVKLDTSSYDNYSNHNGYEIEKIFNIKPNIATKEEIKRYKNNNKFIKKINNILKVNKHVVETPFEFKEDIFEYDNVYLDGYWQSEKYFKDIRDAILREYNYTFDDDKRNKKILEQICNENSVSIHVRRGDYVNNSEVAKIYSGIADLNYYNNAIEYIKDKVEKPTFYIFSNDVEWVRKNLNIENMKIINFNNKENSYKDLFLMSKCKYNIIANSSFSWWGAWLNENKNKIVISPNKWVNTCQALNIIPDGWIKINNI